MMTFSISQAILTYYTRKGNVTIWGENLRHIVEDSKLQKGEYARIVKIGYELRPYSFDKRINGKLWSISTATKVANGIFLYFIAWKRLLLSSPKSR